MATIKEPLDAHAGLQSVSPSSLRALRRKYGIWFYVVRRIFAGALTALLASILIYLAVLILPANTAEIILGRNATPQSLAAVSRQIGANQAIWTRWWHFMDGILTGHLGTSTASLVQGQGVSVSSVVAPAFGHSLVLMGITLALFVPMMLTLGLLAGLKAGSPRDTLISAGSLALSALPEFLIGTVLIWIFFDRLGWLPPVSSIPPGGSALSHPQLLILPVATLLLISLAFGSRQLRASVADVVSHDYVLAAQINGYPRRHVILRYVLPNAVVPSIQIIAQQIQYLFGGIIIVESVFAYPGIGTTLVRAIDVRDVQEIMVISTILAVIYIGINVAADVVCALLDPKVRTTIS